MDFAQYSCTPDQATGRINPGCPMPPPPTDELPLSWEIPLHGHCGVELPLPADAECDDPEQSEYPCILDPETGAATVWRGMLHHSQFKCVSAGAEAVGLPTLPLEVFAPERYAFSRCAAACPEGDPECAADCTVDANGVLTGWSSWQPLAQKDLNLALHLPRPVPADVLALFQSAEGWKYMAVIIPMGLFNVIGSLQNLESAEAAGDRYETRPSLLANGLGSIVAALFGSAFPTTIYIGHPGWKAMGARAGYSLLNGVVVTAICLFGALTLVQNLVPLEATLGILLWIGIIITAQAFEATPKRHALAVAVGLIPALGAWAYMLIEQTLLKVGSTVHAAQDSFGRSPADIFLHGAIALNQGFIVTSMIFAAVMAFVVDRQFHKAAAWTAVAAILSMLGVIHAYELTEAGLFTHFGLWQAPQFALAYWATTALLLALHLTGYSRAAEGELADGF